MRFVNVKPHQFVEFTAKVTVKKYPAAVKIGLRWPKHIRPLKGHKEPTEAKDIPMTVQTFNLLRSGHRRTEGESRFAEVNGEWRKVIFVKEDDLTKSSPLRPSENETPLNKLAGRFKSPAGDSMTQMRKAS